MRYLITENSLARISLNETDTVNSIKQNVAVILSTRRGTVPLDRELGLRQDFLDKPTTTARPLIVAEITEALRKFEGRAELVRVTFTEDESGPGRLIPTVEVEIHEE